MSHRSSLRPFLLRGAALGITLFSIAAPASAASWEQISRGNGGQGATYFSNENVPVFASSTGTFGAVQPRPFVAWSWSWTGRQAWTNLRDVVGNTTRPIAKLSTGTNRSERVFGATADESEFLVRTSPEPGGFLERIVLRPAAGGPDRLVTTADYEDYSYHDARVSGDGSTVAVADGTGLRLVDTATGTLIERFPELRGATFGRNSISDDGKVIAGTSDGQGFFIVGGQVTTVPGTVQVSPDGSKLFMAGNDETTGAPVIRMLRVSTGTTRLYSLPATGIAYNVLWISPDGGRVAYTPNTVDAGVPSRSASATPPVSQSWQLTTSTGTWTKFGREFSTSLNTGSRVSRNGKYAVLEYGRGLLNVGSVAASQAALVDLTGNKLPGSTEALSASSYLSVTPPVSYRGDGKMYAAFGRQAPWLPLPRKGELKVSVDGTQVLSRTFSSPTTSDIEISYPATAQSVTIEAKVVDYVGRTLTTQQTIPVRFYIDEP